MVTNSNYYKMGNYLFKNFIKDRCCISLYIKKLYKELTQLIVFLLLHWRHLCKTLFPILFSMFKRLKTQAKWKISYCRLFKNMCSLSNFYQGITVGMSSSTITFPKSNSLHTVNSHCICEVCIFPSFDQ